MAKKKTAICQECNTIVIVGEKRARCPKCGGARTVGKPHLHCYPELHDLGTRGRLIKFRGSQHGRNIDGNIELAFHRTRSTTREAAAKLLKKCLKYIPDDAKQLKDKVYKYVTSYG